MSIDQNKATALLHKAELSPSKPRGSLKCYNWTHNLTLDLDDGLLQIALKMVNFQIFPFVIVFNCRVGDYQSGIFSTGLTKLFCWRTKFEIPTTKQVKINYFLSNFLTVTLNHETKSGIGDPKRKEKDKVIVVVGILASTRTIHNSWCNVGLSSNLVQLSKNKKNCFSTQPSHCYEILSQALLMKWNTKYYLEEKIKRKLYCRPSQSCSSNEVIGVELHD